MCSFLQEIKGSHKEIKASPIKKSAQPITLPTTLSKLVECFAMTANTDECDR